MRILALIAARGGSKRLVGKNLRPLGGQPLVAWSIRTATESTEACAVLVSTDDPAIADVGRAAGALVPWLRPASLATDTASSVDVALHALDWYERVHGSVDGLMLLQPTSPLRREETVRRGVALFRGGEGASVIAVAEAPAHPMWCFRLEHGFLHPFVAGGGFEQRSQDLPPAYVVNGALYIATPETLRQRRSFVGVRTLPVVCEDADESIDIDTERDWEMAEAAVARRGASAR